MPPSKIAALPGRFCPLAPLTNNFPFQPSTPDSQDKTSLAWVALMAYIREWFYLAPGAEEAFRICFLAALAQSIPALRPIWVMLIGVSGSGKTSCVAAALEAFPGATMIGDLSVNTLLSNFGRTIEQRRKNSLLHQCGKSALLIAKDFTTLLSKKEDAQLAIFAQFREIYDGYYVSARGVGSPIDWTGKATMIAVCTPAMEDHWGRMRDLGERFITVRWNKGDPFDITAAAIKSERAGAAVATGLKERVRAVLATLQGQIGDASALPSLDAGQCLRCIAMGEITGLLRAPVKRESVGKRRIRNVSPHEAPTRVAMAISSICSLSAMLGGRDYISNADFTLGHRIMLDSIPQRRLDILQHMALHDSTGLGYIHENHNIPRGTLRWNRDELRALGVLQPSQSADTSVMYTEDFKRLLIQAVPPPRGLAASSPHV